MMQILRCLLALSVLILAEVPFAHADGDVDLLLVLAVDVSRSIDQAKFMLQRDGYVAAISNRGVLDAIKSGPNQKIALALKPFRQVASAVRPGPAGSGLGLPLTKALAEANRAIFSIKSVPQAGTLIEVAFPPSRVVTEGCR